MKLDKSVALYWKHREAIHSLAKISGLTIAVIFTAMLNAAK